MRARATVHGAVSIVNAIASGRGATLGTDQHATVTAESSPGRGGIALQATGGSVVSSRLVTRTVQKVVPRRILEKTDLTIELGSDIPAGYGLKSSSAISSATALACARLFRPEMDDRAVLLAGVGASIETKVSITGAYDDACACYYGGFNVTDNHTRDLVLHENAPGNMLVVILVPKAKRRGKVKRLVTLRPVFEKAWDLARKAEYWDAMVLNGLATSAILGSDPGTIVNLLERGAVGASVSGNGPAIAAVTRRRDLAKVKRALADSGEGRIITAAVNNRRSEVRDL